MCAIFYLSSTVIVASYRRHYLRENTLFEKTYPMDDVQNECGSIKLSMCYKVYSNRHSVQVCMHTQNLQ